MRSLACARIGLGVAVLADLVWRAFDLRMHYTERGVLPRDELIDLSGHGLSLHAWVGSPALVAALFVFAAVCALALVAGWHTRWATALLWVLTVSLHNRNPLVTTGGDVLLRMLLLWGVFLPWERVWALDACRADRSREGSVVQIGVAGWMAQVFLVHELAGLLKTGADWRRDFTALYYALSLDQLQLPLGKLLLHAPPVLLRGMTASVVWGEMLLPPLLFGALLLPRRWWSVSRALAVCGLASLHLALIATMALGIFPWVNLISLLVFVPSGLWRWADLGRRCDAIAAHLGHALRWLLPGIEAPAIEASVGRPSERLPPLLRSSAGVLLVYVVVQNVAAVVPALRPPAPLRRVAAVLKINQEWNLFAPRPYRNDGWYVAIGHRNDGPPLDLLHAGRPASLERPRDISADFRTYRWRKYLWNLSLERNEGYRKPLAQALCRQWNERHASSDAVSMMQLTFLREWTPPPGEAADVERLSLGLYPCGHPGKDRVQARK